MGEAVRRDLRAIARWCPRDRSSELGAVAPEAEEAFLAGIGEERLTGLAIAALERDVLRLSPAGVEDLYARHEDQLTLDLRLEALLIRVSSVLEGAGIEHRALKGPLLAHVAYDDPALRSFGDVDVLVSSDVFEDSIRTLRPLGFERSFIEPRPNFDARFSKAVCLRSDGGMEIDLHRTLAPGAFGIMVGRADLFARPPRAFLLGDRSVPGLDPEFAFAHSCFHAALGNFPPRLVPLRDIVQQLRAGVDESFVISLATSTSTGSVFRRAMGLVATELGIQLEGRLAEWARALRPRRFDRWALQSYASAERSYAGQIAASLWVLPTMHDRVSYASALAFPSRDYVRARERGYGRRLARGLRVVRKSLPR